MHYPYGIEQVRRYDNYAQLSDEEYEQLMKDKNIFPYLHFWEIYPEENYTDWVDYYSDYTIWK